MRTARARTSVEKRFPGLPFSIAYLPSFWLSGKPGLVQFAANDAPLLVMAEVDPGALEPRGLRIPDRVEQALDRGVELYLSGLALLLDLLLVARGVRHGV